MTIAALCAWLVTRRDGLALPRRDRAWWLLVALELGSAACAANPLGALRPSGLLLVATATYFLARATGPAGLWAPLPALALVALGIFAEASGVWPALSRRGHAPGGFVGERNLAAEILVLGMPLCAWHATTAAPRLRRAALVLLACAATAVTLCRTRSAWIGGALLVAGVATWCLAGPSPRRRNGLVALLAIGLGVAVALVAPTKLRWSDRHPYVETLRSFSARSASATGRAVQYETSLAMLRAHPLVGVGPGGWATQYLAFARPDDPTLGAAAFPVNRLPSSDLVAWVCERGLLAIVLLAIAAWRTWRSTAEHRWLARGCVLVLLPMCALDAVVQLAAPALLLAWTLGAAADPTDSAVAPVGTRVLVGALSVAAILACGRVVAFHDVVRARRVADLERAALLDPGDLSLRLTIAEIEVAAERCDLARPHLAALARRAAPLRTADAIRLRCP